LIFADDVSVSATWSTEYDFETLYGVSISLTRFS